ncbi:hypothetical protein Glove_431g23 [Diversispora epigaea]|uniref:phosphorylase kinase n=1 Tax=Diversispora epigaea TaxID=1348612 RepID=A0A397GWL6_9GLOM|nr:hypothetical protein Glove_431g23 [Diversispora epigaea]
MFKIFDIFKKGEDEFVIPDELEKSYEISKEVLGVGSFAVVKECTNKKTGENYAIKIISKRVIKGKEQMLTTELEILKKIKHPNLISLRDLYESKNGVYIVTDLAKGGELFSQLLEKGSYTEKDAASLVQNVLEGLAYLHDREIVHRDLKPENLLFKDKSDDAILMITDFGLSKILKNQNEILMTACGTPGYVAPEVLLQTGHGKPVDLWSLGVIAYTMLCGYTPFYGDDQNALFESIMSGEYEYEEDYWSEISDLAKDFIDKLLTFNPSKRITVYEALKHPWFSKANNVDILENVRKNFSPKDSFKRAFKMVKGVNLLRKPNVDNPDESTSSKITTGQQKMINDIFEDGVKN